MKYASLLLALLLVTVCANHAVNYSELDEHPKARQKSLVFPLTKGEAKPVKHRFQPPATYLDQFVTCKAP